MAIYLPSNTYFPGVRNRPVYSRTRGQKAVETFDYKGIDVWAAAAAANRINNGYEKYDYARYNDDGEVVGNVVANKKMVAEMLKKGEGWNDSDVETATAAREYWNSVMLKVIAGTANDFEKTAVELSQKETVENFYQIAVISSLISSAERGRAIEQANNAKNCTDSVHVGKPGDKVELTNAEIITSVYNANFGKNRNEAIFENNVFTWWGKQYKVGDTVSVRGRVRDHIIDRNSNVQVTRINYVQIQ